MTVAQESASSSPQACSACIYLETSARPIPLSLLYWNIRYTDVPARIERVRICTKSSVCMILLHFTIILKILGVKNLSEPVRCHEGRNAESE